MFIFTAFVIGSIKLRINSQVLVTIILEEVGEQNMKILLIHLAGGGGGIELYTSQVANSLSRTNNDVALVIGSYVFNEKYYKSSAVKIIQINSQKNYIKMFFKLINPLTYHKLFGIIKREKPDVIHLVLEDLISGVLFCLLKLNGYKLVLTDHDPVLHSGEQILVRVHLSLSKFLLRRTVDKIIVHGNNLKEVLVQKGVSEQKIEIVPHGEFSYYTKWLNEKQQESRNTILFFGRIQDYKGLDSLIEAAPLIRSYIPNLKVIIAGEGNFEKYKSMISDEKCFEIHNRYILDEEIADFFQRANVIVLPYKDGTQSGIIPIAYSFKKPVVVTNVGSIGEVVENGVTGLIVPPQDIEQIAKAVIKILQDDELRLSMGENGYLKIQNELSWEEAASSTVNVYERIFSTNHRFSYA